MDLGQTIAVYLGVFLLIWYAITGVYNRRRGLRVYRWLRGGVESLGKISEARWLGSSGSGARLTVAKAERPFRRVEVVYLLETRELLPLWLINLARGRRDMLIFKANLRSTPQGELEVVRGGDRRLRGLRADADRNPWTLVARSLPGDLQAANRGAQGGRILESLEGFLGGIAPALRRLSISRTAPHLILELLLPPLMEKPSETLFTSLEVAFRLEATAAANGSEDPALP